MYETSVSAVGMGMTPVEKRADRAMRLLDAIESMVKDQSSPYAMHSGWTIIQRSVSHAFDYNARLVGAADLQPVVTPVVNRTLEVVDGIAGGVDDVALRQ
eukprot:10982367-Karenia_brevis.AAC.1